MSSTNADAVVRLPSYQPCEFCGADCPPGTPVEPCWGNVTMWGGMFDDEQLHACEGHSWSPWVPYRPSTEVSNVTARGT